MKGYSVQSIMTRCSSLADGGLTINFHTKELTSTEKALIMDYHNQTGWLLFAENQLSDEDIPKGDAEVEVKTPGQRLRAVLFLIWKNQPEGSFEEFYRQRMETIIDHFKEKLV